MSDLIGPWHWANSRLNSNQMDNFWPQLHTLVTKGIMFKKRPVSTGDSSQDHYSQRVSGSKDVSGALLTGKVWKVHLKRRSCWKVMWEKDGRDKALKLSVVLEHSSPAPPIMRNFWISKTLFSLSYPCDCQCKDEPSNLRCRAGGGVA